MRWPGFRWCVLVAAWIAGTQAASLSCTVPRQVLTSSDATGTLSFDEQSFGPPPWPVGANCTFIITSPGLYLKSLSVDCDSDGGVPDLGALLLRVHGFGLGDPPDVSGTSVPTGEGPGFRLLPERPLRSATGTLLLRFVQHDVYFPGRGISAAWNSTGSSPPVAAALPALPPPPAGASASPVRRVVSAAGLRAALADPSVVSVVLAAHVQLDGGREVAVATAQSQGRSLIISGDAAACGALPPYRAAATGRPVPPGLCAIDALGASGVLRAHGSVNLTVTGVAFVGASSLLGGAVRATGGASVRAEGCLFADCAAVGDGGAAFAAGAGTALELVRCQFLNATSAWGGGGAVAVVWEATASIFDSVFSGWGALYATTGAFLPAVSGCSFDQCRASDYGGAIGVAAVLLEMDFTSALTMRGCNITRSESNVGGGMFYWGRTMSLVDTLFDSCVGLYAAGGFSVWDDTVYPRIEGTPFVLDRVTVTNCTSAAGSGGGMETATYNRMVIRGSRFAGNSAVFNGGGISLLTSTDVRITDTVIEDNTAGLSGGGIRAENTNLTIEGSRLQRNTAEKTGAALFFRGRFSPLRISRSRLDNNTARAGCGAVHVHAASAVSVSDSSLSGNVAASGDGGGFCFKPPGGKEALFTCVSPAPVTIFGAYSRTPDGDLAAVSPGQFVPDWIPACSWVFEPPPGCQYVFSLEYAAQTIPQSYAVTVGTPSSPAPLLRVEDGQVRSGASTVVAAPVDEPLVVNFTSLGQAALTMFDYADGFKGSFWARCDAARDVLSDILLERVVFANNSAPLGVGGAVAIVPGARSADPRAVALAVVDSQFVGCTALSGGGLHATRTNATVSGTRFAGCTATSPAGDGSGDAPPSGGGGAALVSSTAAFAASAFSGNAAAGASGGGLHLEGSVVRLEGSAVTNNSAGRGGAISAAAGTALTLVSNAIDGNYGVSAGGGVAATGGATSVSLAATNVTSNTAGAASLASSSSLDDLAAAGGAQAQTGTSAGAATDPTDAAPGAGDGGGLWASAGATVTVGAASRLNNNSCARFGGAAAVVSASLAFSGGAEASGNRALGGGAVSLVGGGGLNATGAAFRNNSAVSGGFALLGDADDAAKVSLAAVAFERNSAGFGGLFALATAHAAAGGGGGGDNTTATSAPVVPACRDCQTPAPGGGAPAAVAAWFGPTIATPPTSAVLSAPTSSPVNGLLSAGVALFDGFGQAVREFPTIVTVTCSAWQAPAAVRGSPPPPPGPCPAGALVGAAALDQLGLPADGQMAVLYRNSSGWFALRLHGAPGGAFTLRFAFSSSGWPPLAVDPLLSKPIRMEPCLALRVYSADTLQCECVSLAEPQPDGSCACVAGASQTAAGTCALVVAPEKTDERPTIAGTTTGVGAFFLLALALAIVAARRRSRARPGVGAALLHESDIVVGHELGRGAFAVVYAATWRGTPVAVKVWERQSSEPEGTLRASRPERRLSSATAAKISRKIIIKGQSILGMKRASDGSSSSGGAVDAALHQLEAEVRLLTALRHPNVLIVYGVVRTRSKIMMVMALGAKGSLFDVLRASAQAAKSAAASGDDPAVIAEGGLSWASRLSIAGGIAAAVDFLHSHKPPIVHRDLKCGNVVISETLVPQVADFGLSRSVDHLVGGASPIRRQQGGNNSGAAGFAPLAAGTLRYLAPEVLLGAEPAAPSTVGGNGTGDSPPTAAAGGSSGNDDSGGIPSKTPSACSAPPPSRLEAVDTYAFGCTLYEIAHIGTGLDVNSKQKNRSGGQGRAVDAAADASASRGMTSTTLLSASSALGFGAEDLATSWVGAHECSEWWGDPVLLKLPAIVSAFKRSEEHFQLAVRPHVPALFAELIVRCTAFDPAQRPSFAELRRVLIEAAEAGSSMLVATAAAEEEAAAPAVSSLFTLPRSPTATAGQPRAFSALAETSEREQQLEEDEEPPQQQEEAASSGANGNLFGSVPG